MATEQERARRMPGPCVLQGVRVAHCDTSSEGDRIVIFDRKPTLAAEQLRLLVAWLRWADRWASNVAAAD